MNKTLLDWILLYVASLIVIASVQFLFVQGKSLYYTLAPIDNFYELVEFKADNICTGEKQQLIQSTRYVYGTKYGYNAEIGRELHLYKGGSLIKVYEEMVSPFIEVVGSGEVQRLQYIPDYLDTGEYQWILYLTIDVHGVKRIAPPIESNLFVIENCI